MTSQPTPTTLVWFATGEFEIVGDNSFFGCGQTRVPEQGLAYAAKHNLKVVVRRDAKNRGGWKLIGLRHLTSMELGDLAVRVEDARR